MAASGLEAGAAGATERPGVSAALYVAIGLMVLIWSMNYYVAKVVTAEFPPVIAAGLRFTIAGLAILPVYARRRQGGLWRLHGKWSWTAKVIAAGLLAVGVNQFCFLAGMQRTSVSHASLIVSLTPAFVLTLAAFVGQERITPVKVMGLALAIGGIGVLQAGRDEPGGSSWIGDLLVFGSVFSFGAFAVWGKSLTSRFDTLTVNTFAFAGSAAVFLPVAAWMLRDFALNEVSWAGWAGLFYMALGSSLLCHMIYFRALESFSASRVSALSYLQPLIAISTAVPLLGEPITGALLGGGALVLIGVFLAERA